VPTATTEPPPAVQLLPCLPETGPQAAQSTRELATSGRPLPRYGRHPQRQQEHLARQAARTQRYEEVQTRYAQGHSIRQIAQACGVSRHTVRHWLRTATLPPDQRGYRGPGKIDRSIPYLQTRLAEGCTNQSRLWREICAQGFTGTRSLVAKWIHAHGHTSPRGLQPSAPALPAARELAWLLVQDADKRTAEAQDLVERLQQHAELAHVQELVQQGRAMIRQRHAAALVPWLEACRASPSAEVRNFADGLQQERAAVQAALTLPWSTGPVEGHINRLKLIKRSGYGRMKFDLLRQRVLYDAA
jgi:transposase